MTATTMAGRIRWYAGAVLIAALAVGCGTTTGGAGAGGSAPPAPAAAGSAAAGSAVGARRDMLVTSTWLAEHLTDPNLVIIHVAKTPAVYEKGHIPGARFLSLQDIGVTREGLPNEFPPVEDLVRLVQRLGIDADDRIVIYDEEQGIPAARGYVMFDLLGMGGRAALLDGQLKVWASEGRPVATEIPPVTPSTYVPRMQPYVVATREDVQFYISAACPPTTPVSVVDARPEAEYSGKEAGEGIKRPGHIPKAKNVPAKQNIVSDERPVLRSPEALRALYDKAGVKSNHQVVTYCRTGGQGSLAYFVLKYLGHEVQLYDGSFAEWSADEGAEVRTGSDP
ncbi:MAG: sulfurtransferase [Planctomycetes bacterium]|nr:sulfurtransferase [Planctomycetota bacterium]